MVKFPFGFFPQSQRKMFASTLYWKTQKETHIDWRVYIVDEYPFVFLLTQIDASIHEFAFLQIHFSRFFPIGNCWVEMKDGGTLKTLLGDRVEIAGTQRRENGISWTAVAAPLPHSLALVDQRPIAPWISQNSSKAVETKI
jgi:hypothetical protein